MDTMIDFTGFFDTDGHFHPVDPTELAVLYISFSEKARREGLLALEDDLMELGDGFMKLMLMLVIDGTDPELVRQIGENHRDQALAYLHGILQCVEYTLNAGGKDFESRFSLYCRSTVAAPSITLLEEIATGLRMQLSGDAQLSREDLSPRYRDILEIAASGIEEEEKAEMYGNHLSAVLAGNERIFNIILTATLAVQSGDNPRIVRDKLISFIDPRGRAQFPDLFNESEQEYRDDNGPEEESL